MDMQIGNRHRRSTITAGVTVEEHPVAVLEAGPEQLKGLGQSLGQAVTVIIGYRRSEECHLIGAIGRMEGCDIQPFQAEILSILEA